MRSEWDNRPEVLGKTRVCAICGKEFVPAVYHQYVDYLPRSASKRYFCSYHCYSEKDMSGTGRRRSAVVMYDINGIMLKEFKDAKEASLKLAEFGVEASVVGIQRCCRGERESYKGFIFKYKQVEEQKNE